MLYKYLSQSVICIFFLLTGSFAEPDFKILIKPGLLTFPFLDYALGVKSNNSLPSTRSQNFLLFLLEVF